VTATASTTRSIAEAHARLKTHADIQFDLPAAKPPEVPGWLRWLIEHLGFLGNLGNVLFWVIVTLLVGLVLWLVYRWARNLQLSRRPVEAPEQEVAAWRPEEKVARALLAEADAMAEAGRYEEAAHLLLQRSLEDIARRRPKVLRPALTSREIARVAALPNAVRGAFAAMAAPVERSLFGGRSLTRAAWEEARSAYRAFALPEAWT